MVSMARTMVRNMDSIYMESYYSMKLVGNIFKKVKFFYKKK